MEQFRYDHNGDTRFAVVPGVLHNDVVWGNGTTEYALEALQAASNGMRYACPIEMSVVLPMIYVDDLTRGLIALQDTPEEKLQEPQNGYCIPGLSFNAEQLFAEIRKHCPEFSTTVELNDILSDASKARPDTLSTVAASRDLNYEPSVQLPEVVQLVLEAHRVRNQQMQNVFSSVDVNGNGTLESAELEGFVSSLITGVRPRVADGLAKILVKEAMVEMDTNRDGRISIEEFQMWSRTNNLNKLVEDFMS